MNLDAIPQELRERRQWVVWRTEVRDGKPTKVPFTASGVAASSTDPATWATFDEVVAAAPKFDGIGYVFSPDDPYTGVDLDDCFSEGFLAPSAAGIVLRLDSFCEVSPTGTGVKLIVRASKNGNTRCRTRAFWGGDLEVYDHARFWTITGNPLRGTRPTIEDRQPELDALLAEFLPEPEVPDASIRTPQPVGLDDRELLDKMFASKSGDKISRLWNGDTSEYGGDDSAADLALCNVLAWWTNRDAPRMDSLFRSSALVRPKWDARRGETTYGERTISTAIAATSEGYRPSASQVRPSGDAPSSNTPVAGPVGAGASLRPPYKGTQDGPHLQRTASVDVPDPPSSDVPAPLLVVVEGAAFAAVDEASAAAVLGDAKTTILSAGGTLALYGDGGAGKTTLGLDQAVHLAAGKDWLGLPVPRPCQVLWIENEGPRGKFREKLRAKLDAWDGPSLEGRLHVLEQPWSLFTFSDEQHRRELVALIRELKIDVLFAGPVQRLGVEGGGTPAEIQAFVNLLEQVRAELDRPLAYELIHHENKSGDVSGAWEGATDTLAHVQARGNGHTAIVWRKVRWASELHGKTWNLDWRDGESFEIDDTPETTDDAIADQLLGLVHEAPGGSWNAYDPLVTGKGKRKRIVRDQLLADGRLVNAGTGKAMRLFLPEQVDTLPVEDES